MRPTPSGGRLCTSRAPAGRAGGATPPASRSEQSSCSDVHRRHPQRSLQRSSTRWVSGLPHRPELMEVRTLAFAPWKQATWDTPGVDHENPPDQQFHGALVLGAASLDAIRGAVGTAVKGLEQSQAEHLVAAHAYDVELTLIYRDEDRPTLPQTADTPAELIQRPKLSPQRRSIPTAPPRSQEPRSTIDFPAFSTISLPGDGPEDVILDADEKLITGLSGGRIVRIDPETEKAEVIADTGGRPLGFELLPDGRLLACDAHRGLLRVDPVTGTVETLVEHVRGVPLRFCSNAAVESDGTIWFTESTSRFDFEHFLGSLLEHRPSGRVFRRDVSGEVEIVVDDLYFANGIALVPDGTALLYAETAAARISRLPLTGTDAGHPHVVADNLPAYPDNLSDIRGRANLGRYDDSPRSRAGEACHGAGDCCQGCVGNPREPPARWNRDNVGDGLRPVRRSSCRPRDSRRSDQDAYRRRRTSGGAVLREHRRELDPATPGPVTPPVRRSPRVGYLRFRGG